MPSYYRQLAEKVYPNGKRIGRWTVFDRTILHENRWVALADVSLRKGREEKTFSILLLKPSVIIVALTADRKIVLIRQERFGSRTHTWELPAEVAEDRESLSASAIRGAKEEFGMKMYRSVRVLPLMLYALPARATEQDRVVVLKGVTFDFEKRTDRNETTACKAVTLKEAQGMIKKGQIIDAVTIAVIQWIMNVA